MKKFQNYFAKMGDIVQLHVLPAEQGWFPSGVPLSMLEQLAQDDFATRGMKVVQGFFKHGHPLYPYGIDFLLIGQKEDSELVGSLIVEKDSVDGFGFLYVTKANVALSYHGNGLLNKMIVDVGRIAEERGVPVVLRTSDERASKKYAKSHDIFTRINGYYVHGFGFQNKGTRIERFHGARKLFANKIAPYVATKPPTVVPIKEQVAMPDVYIAKVADQAVERAHYLNMHPFAKKALGLSNRNIY